ncbi:porin family protein [Hymenobacter chitinivorans]|uniref:Opacity protein-like surface antigen n=1 Tax=Hymenobacter chitinivorans DSM 11115 TaxID=1121954 RepID=A0A2M9ASU0_9BACT|nr:porin family protein [Hymenobacter chitinivorans]PJJ48768.1 opacity protein-like surface antigen [Hymenobacter chitinivorans DSM 11115]
MKKLLLALLTVGAAAGTASAQVEIGLKLSPSITYLRADGPSSYNFQNEKSKLSLGGGLVVDYFFGQNYAFSSGVWLSGKGGTISYLDRDPNSSSTTPSVRREQKIALQYLEVPVTVKLFTNDITTDTKLYFQLGVTAGGVIAARINGDKRFIDASNGNTETKASKHVIIPDMSALIGAGVEYQVGQSTKVFAGLSYHRGLVNIDNYFEDERGFQDVTLKNNEVALDLGLKF